MNGHFWRNQSYYHRRRATTWRRIALVLGGILTGITIVSIINLVSA